MAWSYKFHEYFSLDLLTWRDIIYELFTQQLKRQDAAYTANLNGRLNIQREELKWRFERERDLKSVQVLASYHEELTKLHGMAKRVQLLCYALSCLQVY